MSESLGSRPMHLRIVDELRRRIDSGELAPGAQLPSTQKLMAEFGVSSQTAQRGVRVLKTEGLVEGISGKGVFVKQRGKLVTRTVSGQPANDDDRNPLHHGAPALTDLREAQPPAEVVEALGLPEGGKALLRRTTWSTRSGPVELVASYYPLDLVRGGPLAEPVVPEMEPAAVFAMLGYEPGWIAELVEARMPTPDEARTLRLGTGTAVLQVHRELFAADGLVLEVEESVLPADRYRLRYEVRLPLHD